MTFLPFRLRQIWSKASRRHVGGKNYCHAAAINEPQIEGLGDAACVLHMASPTHYANLMIRYMVAVKLASLIPDLRISNIDLRYWDINYPSIASRATDRVCQMDSEQYFYFQKLQYLATNKIASRFEWLGYGQRLENFPSLSICRSLFQASDKIGRETSDDCILCPVRGAEILNAIHPGYTVMPIAFYEEMIERSQLRPVFMGQTVGDNVYTNQLRKRFPRAEFLPHTDPLEDFQTIRKAKHIILPVSTFAWLAAWLSHADTILLPVFGILNPKLFTLDLLPIADARYRFYQFPEQAAVPLDGIEEAHAQIRNQWFEVSGSNFAPSRI